ncbi:MAG: TetR-like C-terminal domain-containing protein [bacterium]|nr:TetR-like C-terminal domain-containing protein [bacterium]
MSRERMINHTKLLLKQSLLELLNNKPLSKITIKELCDKVDINRTTYYRYYLDPYDQLEKIEVEIFNDMASFIDTNNVSNNLSRLKSILKYINDRKEEFRILLVKSDINFQNKLLSFIGKRIFENKCKNDINLEIKYIYTAVGSFGIVSEWIKGNLNLSLDELSEKIIELNQK